MTINGVNFLENADYFIKFHPAAAEPPPPHGVAAPGVEKMSCWPASPPCGPFRYYPLGCRADASGSLCGHALCGRSTISGSSGQTRAASCSTYRNTISYIGSISASPTACLLLERRSFLSTGMPIPP